ncbi:MAG: hypothetical protein GY775_16635 [Candidatus Scalindua sp.]|nr:hypothetical protein [Candidatus Scalindua sp.]
MLDIKNVKVYGLEESIVRSGYPMQVGEPEDLPIEKFFRQEVKAYSRCKKLGSSKHGSGHDNFLKGVIVQFDLKYPQYFTPQLQRYSWIDIISSQSKMHKLISRESFTREDFTEEVSNTEWHNTNKRLHRYKTNPSKELELKLLANLPMGFMMWMGISTNYLQLKTIYLQRKNHKLDEWRQFCKWIEELPMFKELILKT